MANDNIGDIWFEMNMGGNANKNAKELLNNLRQIAAFADAASKTMNEEGVLVDKKVAKLAKENATPFLKSYEKAAQMLNTVNGLIQQANTNLGKAAVFGGNKKGITAELKVLTTARAELEKALSNKNPTLIGTDLLSAMEAKIKTVSGNLRVFGQEINNAVSSKKFGKSLEVLFDRINKQYSDIRSSKSMAKAFGVDDAEIKKLQSLFLQLGNIRKGLENAAKSGNEAKIANLTIQYDALSKRIAIAVQELNKLSSAQRRASGTELGGKTLLASLGGREADLRKSLNLSNSLGLKSELQSLTTLIARVASLKSRLSMALQSGNIGEVKKLANEYRVMNAEITSATKRVQELAAAQRQSTREAERQESAQRRASSTALSGSFNRSFSLGGSNAYDNILGKMDQLNNKTSLARNLFSQLQNQMAMTFLNVYGIEAMLKNVITIGGEFERQHKALQVILGDMQQADTLYGQLKSLAVESPFTFKDLATYSKQLAAFSIPYRELYDTTNRLSDLSAGLGVDMSRLILAYGQVRSATVLRGQELRQFTEAGVPMVQKLADYFTELKGKVVDTSEVFDMISKKEVPFEAVKQVLEDLTNEGGEFYQMQGKIADTLSGRFTNLKDSWEIMLSSFANGNSMVGASLKNIILLATSLIRNVNLITAALAGLGGAKLLSKTNIGAVYGLRKTDSSFDYGTGYLQAKRLEAVQAQRRIITAELLAKEGALTMEQEKQLAVDKAIVKTRNRMTNEDWAALASSGQLTKWQIVRLANEKKITREKAEQLLLAQGLTKEQIKSSFSAGFIGRAKDRIGGFFSGITSSLSALFSPMNLIFTAFSAAIAGVAYYIQDAAEKTRKAQQVIDEAKSQSVELNGFLNSNDVEVSSDPAEAKRAYDKFKEELYKHAPNAEVFLVRLKLDYGEDFQKQAEEIRSRLENELAIELRISGLDTGTIKDVLESANGLFDESYQTNIKDFVKSEGELENALRGLRKDEFEKFLQNASNSSFEYAQKAAESAKKILKATGDIKAAGKEFLSQLPNAHAFVTNDRLAVLANRWVERSQDASEDAKTVADKLREQLSEALGDLDGDGKLTEKGKLFVRNFVEKMAASEDLSDSQKKAFTEMIVNQFNSFSPEEVSARIAEQMKVSLPDLMATARTNPEKAREEIERYYSSYLQTFQLNHGVFNQNLQNYVNAHPMQIKQALLVSFGLADEKAQKNSLQEFLREKFGDTVYVAASLETVADVTEAIKKVQEYQKGLQEKIGTGKKIVAAQLGIKFDLSSGFDSMKRRLDSWIKDNPKSPFLNWLVKPLYDWISGVSDAQKGLKSLGITPDESKTAKQSTSKSKGAKQKPEDKQLKAAQKWLSEYQKFWSDLQSKRRQFGESAFGMIKNGGLYEELMRYIGVDNMVDFDKSVDIIIKKLGKLSSEERKTFARQAKEAKSRNDNSEETNRITLFNEKEKEKLEILNEQYEVYKKLYQLTGNRAGSAAFAGADFTSDTVLGRIKKELNNAIDIFNQKASSNYSAADILGMDNGEFDEKIGKGSYIGELRTAYLNEEKKLRKEILDLTVDALSKEFEIEDKIKKENAEYERRKGILQSQLNAETDTNKKSILQKAIENLGKEHAQKQADLNLSKDKRNIGWDVVFGNLGNASTAILGKVADLIKRTLKNSNLSPESAKSLVDSLNKINDELVSRNPFLEIVNAFRGGGMSETQRSALQSFLANNYKKEYTLSDEEAKKYELKAGKYKRSELEDAAYSNPTDRFEKALSAVEKDFKAMHDILDPLLNMLDALGVDVGSIGDLLSAPGNALSAASNTAGSFNTLSSTFKGGFGKVLGDIAPYAAGAAAGFSIVTSLFQLHDKALQKEIEASERRQKEMENLTDSLKTALERALGGQYSVRATEEMLKKFEKYGSIVPKTLIGIALGSGYNYISNESRNAIKEAQESKSYYDASFASMLVQRDETQHQLDLERDKKKKDKDKILDYEKQLEELDDKIKNFAIDMAKELYEIDIKSWAKQLSDALSDAWANGEDAALAYKRTVNDIMKSVAKNIVATKIMEQMMKPVEDLVAKEMEENNGMLNEDSIKRIADLTMSLGSDAAKSIFAFFDTLKSNGFDLSDTSGNSTIGKGIQSVTEDTADLLASYINAIRADVSVKRQKLTEIADERLPDMAGILNLQLTELRNLSSYAERNARAAESVRDMLDSVITTGSGGKRIRV